MIAHLLVDPDDIGDALLHRPPLDTEPTGELVAEVRLVEVPGGGGVQEQPASVEGPPLPVGALGHVGHEHVGVEVRVTGPAGPVPERRDHETVDLDLVHPVLPGTGPSRLALDVRERGVDRGLVRVANHRGRVGITETGEQRHGLRCPKSQVEPGDLPTPEPAELLARRRVEPGPDRVEVVGSDFAVESRGRAGGPGPSAGRFADAAVVLVDPVGDGVEVVVLTGELDLAETQHGGAPSGRVPAVAQIAVSGRDDMGTGRSPHLDASRGASLGVLGKEGGTDGEARGRFEQTRRRRGASRGRGGVR